MVTTGFSTRRIRSYLKKWALWWVKTAETWRYEELLNWFIQTCWQIPEAAIAEGLRQQGMTTTLPCEYSSLAWDCWDGCCISSPSLCFF